ncbi:MAG TPA: helix-turn-helix domain-containing protein [Mucilaginibacter sp.]
MLIELKQLIGRGSGEARQWLKSNQVRKMLNISPGTLQNLRINGTLRYTKVGSILYYKAEDIDKLMNGGLK